MAKRRRRTRRRGRQDRQRELLVHTIIFGIAVLIAFTSVIGFKRIFKNKTQVNAKAQTQEAQEEQANDPPGRPDINVKLLTVNEYSRPATVLKKVKDIVIHYTANPNTTAMQNRNYFENLKDEHTTKASSHFIIGLEGEIVQCIPTKEISYASNDRNSDTISIENCHVDESGKFNDATYQSLVKLTAWLCKKYDLTSDNVIRHYDVTGKECPKYFVDHEDAWTQLKEDVKKAITLI